MRVLVPGGAGFIGSHLIDVLMAQGNDILCVDNLFSGSRRNIQQHLPNPRFEFLRHDIVQPLVVETDRIFNLACPASPVHYQSNAVKTVKSNVIGTLHCLGIAKRVGARILQASTSEVYGDPQVHPQTEDYWGHVNPIGPRSCYDEGKRVAETLMLNYHTQNGVDVRIARIFNTYGPRMSIEDGRVVSNFIVQALRGQPMTVYGEGTQTRSFCYVSDLVAGLIALMGAEGLYTPVNLGNPQEVTVVELAEMIRSKTKSRSDLVFKDLPQDDPVRRRPDTGLAREALGWAPEVELSDGLDATIQYFDDALRSNAFTP